MMSLVKHCTVASRCFPLVLLTAAASLLLPANQAAANRIKILHSFCSEQECADGSVPQASLIMDLQGNLYGTTYGGGTNFRGTVFELSPGPKHWQFKTLYSFCSKTNCKDGQNPSASLIVDVAGNLYGTTSGGGAHSWGTVFELSPQGDSWTHKTLHSFCAKDGCADGQLPMAGLTYQGAQTGAPYDGSSPLFGTTVQGGTATLGVAYRLTPVVGQNKWAIRVIHAFCSELNCADGSQPLAAMITDASGNLYGTTSSNNVFELSPHNNRWKETVLHTFTGASDGSNPVAPLLMDVSGNLFGTTLSGGNPCCGVAFKLSPAGSDWQYSLLYNFCSKPSCRDGTAPRTSLVMDAEGNLFGTTSQGGRNPGSGAGAGTIFELNGAHQTLYNFCAKPSCADGAVPYAGLLMDAAGNLYGTTTGGGANNDGTVFEFVPD